MDYVYRYLLKNPAVAQSCDPPVWIDLGCALGGDFGEPILFGTGPLTPNSLGSIDLAGAPPNAPVGLFVSAGPSMLVVKTSTA